MGIKSIFSMLKADRYTHDGRDKLAEDKTYQTGQISEKTGLQKQPDGSWAPPKNGNGKTMRPGESKPDTWKENTDYLGRKRISMETPQGGKVSIYESDNTKQKNGRFRVDTGSHYNEFNTMEEAKAFAEEQYGKPAGATGNEEQRKRKNFMENSQKHFEAANSVATTETDKANLKKIKSFMDEEHGTFKNALYNNAESLVRKGSNGAPDRENEKSLLKFAEAAGMGDDLKLYLKEEVNSKYEFGGGDAEKKPDGADRHDQVGGEIKDNLEAAKYYFDKAQSFSTTDPSYKTYMGKAKEYNDKAKAQADDYGFDFEEMHNSGVTRAVNKYTEEQSKPAESKPAAPRQLTGDTRIRVRKP